MCEERERADEVNEREREIETCNSVLLILSSFYQCRGTCAHRAYALTLLPSSYAEASIQNTWSENFVNHPSLPVIITSKCRLRMDIYRDGVKRKGDKIGMGLYYSHSLYVHNNNNYTKY